MLNLGFSVLNKFLQKDKQQLMQLMPLGLMCFLTLLLSALLLMEKMHSPQEVVAIDRVSYPAKVNFNWFGSKEVVVKPANLDNIYDDLPMANINAQLLGVVLAGDESSATVKFGGSKEVVHFSGEKLDTKTTIVDIQSYRLVVRQDGVNKQMLMKKPDSIIEQSQSPDTNSATSNSGFSLANMFGAVPVIAGGKTGFKINQLSLEMQQLADIQDGDIVTGVDGVAVRDIMANPSEWLKFSASTNLPVTLVRDGEEQVVYINASSLSAKMMPNLGYKP
jgi:type II secretory pathway component PulC